MSGAPDDLEALARAVAKTGWDRGQDEYWGDDPYRMPFDLSIPDDEDEQCCHEWLDTVREILTDALASPEFAARDDALRRQAVLTLADDIGLSKAITNAIREYADETYPVEFVCPVHPWRCQLEGCREAARSTQR